MGQTSVTGKGIRDASIQRSDLDTVTATQAVIAKLVQGSGITLSSTGVDSGTGDVTINTIGSGVIILATGTLNSALPSTYNQGISVGSITTGDGWPISGTLEVVRYSNERAYQVLRGQNLTYIRSSFDTDAWGSWNMIIPNKFAVGAPVISIPDGEFFTFVKQSVLVGTEKIILAGAAVMKGI